MSLSISGTSAHDATFDTEATAAQQKPVTKPSVDQEMQQMLSSGDSVSQIAAQMGLSTTLVDSTLGLQTTTATAGPSASATAAAMKLSVFA